MRLDLNLLVVIEAIMLERNVTRAAASLAMSQPAVSNALRRARKLTHDQLFLKVADGVQPTSRMLAIWPELHHSLAVIRASIAPENFDPRSDPTSFRIAVTDSLASEAVTGIALKLRAMAPYARVAFSFHTNATSLDGIERGTLDCAVGMFPALPRGINVQGLRTDRYVCVMRREHALEKEMTLDQFVAASHVLVTPSGMDLGAVDGWLSLHGRRRMIVTVVNHFADALRIVAQSDLLTCVPSGFINGPDHRSAAKHELVVRSLPFETEKLVYKLVWHERLHTHPAHQWFRSLVAGVCAMPGETTEPSATPSAS
ncbi:DNA-binding transcriptional regulator, LysR family [Rhizobium mongolense subsp. loessense]|uniref:DNA-binding transcriptional regulator, LysR family n=2 Tax=Rhizobium mongolense TaxID=57676 RepID=A0A1G4S510_9HYPH|nr:DNA-binding transcriptional regulator, LysR family [Rhizobium mongolense subsp. loessense]